MLEETADDAAFADVVAHAGDAGPQAAHAAHVELDLDARLRRPVEAADQRLVDQRVHLEDQVRLFPTLRMRDLAVDALLDTAAHRGGRHQKLAVVAARGVAGELVEHHGGVGAEIFVAGEIAEVGVLLRGDAVVVAGAEMHVAADTVAFAAHDEHDLGVRLEADEPVHHVHALALEGLGPADVALFVEARLELEEDGHLLAVGGGLHQRVDDRRVAAHAVERGLDGQHVGVVGGGAHEVHDRVERVVGVVQQDVPLADGGEDVGLLGAVQHRRRGLHQRLIRQVGAVDALEVPEAAEAEGRLDRVDVLLAQLEVLAEDAADALRHVLVDGDADHRAEPPPAHEALDGLEQVVGLELLDGELGVAGHAEGVRLEDLHTREEGLEVRGDDLLEPGEPLLRRLAGILALFCRCAVRRGHGHQAGQRRARHLDAGEALLPALVAHQHGEVVAHVGDVREGPPGVEGERREHREDLLGKVCVESRLLGGVERSVVDDVDAGGVELRAQLAEAGARLLHEVPGALLDQRQELLRGVPVRRDLHDAGVDLLAQTGDADHEELAEDGAEDADELHALEQRVVDVARLVHDALEEIEHAELAVDVERGVAQVGVGLLGGGRDVCGELLVGRLGAALDGLAAVILVGPRVVVGASHAAPPWRPGSPRSGPSVVKWRVYAPCVSVRPDSTTRRPTSYRAVTRRPPWNDRAVSPPCSRRVRRPARRS